MRMCSSVYCSFITTACESLSAQALKDEGNQTSHLFPGLDNINTYVFNSVLFSEHLSLALFMTHCTV